MLAPFAFNFKFEFPCQKLAKKLYSFGHEEKFRKLKNPTTVHVRKRTYAPRGLSSAPLKLRISRIASLVSQNHHEVDTTGK